MKTTTNTASAKVELYNLTRGSRVIGNGFYVFRYVNGCRSHELADFGSNEAAARAFAEAWKPGADAYNLRVLATNAAQEGLSVAEYVSADREFAKFS